MSTNHTANYDLCQWEATDQVLRTDFNEDNAKIEAALNSKLSAIEVVAETTITSNAAYFSLDLTDVDWDQWSVVAVVSDPLPSASAFSSLSINCPTVNIQREISGEVTPAVGPNLLLLFPMRDGGRQIRYLVFPGGQMAASAQGTYNDITGLTLSSNASNGFRTGSSIKVYGIH